MQFPKFAVLICALLLPVAALSQNYPIKPITIVVGAAPGGPTDVLVRPLAAQLQERLGQPLVILNQGGAGGNIAAAQVARAPADGYMLLATADAPIVVNPSIYQKLPYDPQRDLRPIAMLGDGGDIALTVTSDSPARTVQQLVEILRKDPKASYVSSGVGYPSHIVSELFKREARFDAVHIPSKGAGNGLIQLLSGGISFYFMPASMAASQAKGGKIRVLAVAASRRNHLLSEIPTMAESGFAGVSPVPYWVTLFAPKGTPREVIDRLSVEVRKVMGTPELKQVIEQQGLVYSNLGPDELTRRVASDFSHWQKAVKPLGIRVD